MSFFCRHILRALIVGLPVLCIAPNAAYATEKQSPLPSASDRPRQPVPISLPESTATEPLRRLTPRGESTIDESGEGSRLPTAGSIIAALAMVLIVALGAARFWKSFGPQVSATASGSAAEVIGRCRIEQRQTLYLVRVGTRILVVGSGGGELTTLSEISDAAEVDLIVARCQSRESSVSPFARMFAARQTTDESSADRPADRSSFPVQAEARPFRTTVPSPEERLAQRLKARPIDWEAERVA